MRVLLVLSLLIAVLRAEEPRLAVLGSPGDARVTTFADLLTVELSQFPDQLAMVERTELQKLEQEAEVQKMQAADRPMALARLAHADALVLAASDRTDPKSPRVLVRLTDCTTGLILSSLVLDGQEKDLPAAAKHAAGVLRFPVQRMAKNQSEPATVISLLGVRQSMHANDPFAVTLNTALAHQLSCQPGIIVAERWRLDDAVFERSLAQKEMPALTTGSVLLDGFYEKREGGMAVTLRVQEKGEAQPRTIRLEGLEGGPSAMALRITETLTTQLKGKAMVPWDAKEEAAQYAGLGQWLVARRMGIESAQALESAIALGDNAPETLVARMRAYATIVCPVDDKLDSYDLVRHDVDGLDQLDEETFKVAIHSMVRLAGNLQQLVDSDWKGFEQSRFKPNLRQGFLRNLSGLGQEVLQAIHVRGEQQKHAADARTLRAIIRHLIDAGKTKHGPNFSGSDLYIGYIFDTPEEALKEYRTMFEPKRMSGVGKDLRSGLWNVARNGNRVPPLIDWSGTDQSRADAAWEGFIRELGQSKHILNRWDALALAYQKEKDTIARTQLLNQYMDLLEKSAAEMATPVGQLSLPAFGKEWISPREKFDAQLHRRFAEQLASIMEKADWVEYPTLFSAWTMTLNWSTALDRSAQAELAPVASRLMAAIDSVADRAPNHARWTGTDQKTYLQRIGEMRQHLWKTYPSLATSRSAPSVPDAVQVRAWEPNVPAARANRTTSEYGKGDWLYSYCMRWDGSRLFVLLRGGHMVSLDPRTMKAESFATPPLFRNLSVAITGGEMMMETGKGLFLCNYRKAPGIWKETSPPDMPPVNEVGRRVLAMGNDFYVSSRLYRNSSFLQHFIARYSNGAWSWIASSNRRPAQHPFDEVAPRSLLQIFPGPQGKPMLLTEYPSMRDHEVLDLETGKRIAALQWDGIYQRSGDMPLHWEVRSGEITHTFAFDPTREKPRMLFRNPSQYVAKEWDKVTPEFDCRKEECQGEVIAPVIHGGRLWLLKWERPSGSLKYDPNLLRLVGFDLNTRKSVVVPLKYAVPDAIRGMNFGNGMDFSKPRIHGESLTATSDALFFAPGHEDPSMSGISPVLFHVRWAEVNAWISKRDPTFLPSAH